MGFSDLVSGALEMAKSTGRGNLWKAAFKKKSEGKGGLDASAKYYNVNEDNMNDPELNARMQREQTNRHRDNIDKLPLEQKYQLNEQNRQMRSRAEQLSNEKPVDVSKALEVPELEGLPELRIKKQMKTNQMRSPSFLTNR